VARSSSASTRRLRLEEPVERLDALDQRIVAALQIHGRAGWREIAQYVDSSESTVARRARALTASGALLSTVAMNPIKCDLGYPVLLQFRCEPSRGRQVARMLAARPDIRFVTVVTGPFDVVAELIVPSKHHLAHFLFEELALIEGVYHTSTEAVLRNFKTAYNWSSDLLKGPAPQESTPSYEALTGKQVRLDDLDRQLVERLREDGRRGFSQLAATLHITESMARRRVEALVNSGALEPITLVDPRLLGYDIELIIWLQVDLGKLEQVAAALAARPEVRYLSATSGYSDLVGEVILRTQDDLYAFRMQTLGSMPDIRSADMALELQTVKRAFLRLDDDPG
jgi:DNA-binding Lrp family transcriptional regulator